MLKNQAHYAQNYAHKIKLCLRADCFIRVFYHFLTALPEYFDLIAEKNANNDLKTIKIISVLVSVIQRMC